MARLLETVLCLTMPGVCSASHFRHPIAEHVDEATPICSGEIKTHFGNLSAVLRRDPGGVLQSARGVIFSGEHATSACAGSRNYSNHGFWVVFVEDFDTHNVAGCCALEERTGMDVDGDGMLLPFAQAAIGEMDRGSLGGVNYLQIAPSSCMHGCPLVVELTGNGGYPWLMVRHKCKQCRSELGVLMISPVLPRLEDTSAHYVNDEFIPFVKAYLGRNSFRIDAMRVYLVCASRGIEIGLLAAVGHPELWRSVLTTGKFRFTQDFWNLVSTPGIVEKVSNTGLESIILNIGDQDPIFTDEEYYSNLTRAVRILSKSSTGPPVRLNIFPNQGHGTSPGVWTRWSQVIWSGVADPWGAF